MWVIVPTPTLQQCFQSFHGILKLRHVCSFGVGTVSHASLRNQKKPTVPILNPATANILHDELRALNLNFTLGLLPRPLHPEPRNYKPKL